MRVGDEVEVTVTYLEMLVPPADAAPPPPDGIEVRQLEQPSAAEYRRLYDAVGGDWYWVDRRRLAAEDLTALLADPGIEVHVLAVHGEEVGFAELDRRNREEVQLVYFGLVPGFIGRGLGRWFLRWVVDRAWSYGARRVWLDTCTLDHPRALPNYQAAGFRPYDTRMKVFKIPW